MKKLQQTIKRKFLIRLFIPGFIIFTLLSLTRTFHEGEHIYKDNKIILNTMANEVQNYLESSLEFLKIPGENPRIENKDSLKQSLIAITKATQKFDRIVVVDYTGTIIATAPPGISSVDFPIQLPAWDHPILPIPRISPISDKIVIYINWEIKGYGKVIAELNLERMYGVFAKVLRDTNKKLMVTDKYGNIISHPDPDFIREQYNIGNLSIFQVETQDWHDGFFKLDGKKYWGTKLSLLNPEWNLILYEPQRIFLTKVMQHGTLLALVSLSFMFLMVLFLSFELKKGVIDPLSRFSYQVQEIGRGAENIKSESFNQYEELYILNKELRSMQNQVKKRERDLKEEKAQIETINKKLEKQKEDMACLIKEVHHRTKNNLGTIISMLSLQKNKTSHEEVQKALDDSISRIQTIASLHDFLNSGESLEKINLKSYVTTLVAGFSHALIRGNTNIRFHLELEDIDIAPQKALYHGLVLNELITNSLKYAFPSQKEGNIKIRIKQKEDHFTVRYTDDGIGFSSTLLNNLSEKHLGLLLIQSIVESQLESSLSYKEEQGMYFEYTVKKQF